MRSEFAARGVMIGVTTAVALSLAAAAGAQNLIFQAESGVRTGTVVSSAVAGYTGAGYVTDFTAATDAVRIASDVPDGRYELWLRYRSQYGEKGYNYRVDAVSGSGMFNPSTTFADERVGFFKLSGGVNELEVSSGWGYYDLDRFELRPFSPRTMAPIAPALVDPQASYRTQVLMNYLTSVYGVKTLAGQQHVASENRTFPGAAYLSKSGGLTPALRSSDFIEYSPTRRQNGSTPDNETEQSIAWAQQTGGVVSMMWHWNAPDDLINTSSNPWWRGFYTDATTFDLPAALANPQGEKYQKILRDIDAIAVELAKFQAADVPVIWRPLHEAQGAWFWWGAHGPETFKQLWRLTHDRLTNYHGLHNLIWEFTSSAAVGDHLAWYPGDDVVDMIGLDVYTDASSNMTGEWFDTLETYDGRKMIALSETGTFPDAQSMADWGIRWSYFSPWTGDFINNVPEAAMRATLWADNVVTLDELPALPWAATGGFLPSDFNFDEVVDGGDWPIWIDGFGVGPRGDATGDGVTDGADLLLLQRELGRAALASAGSQAVPEPAALLPLGLWAAGFAAGRLRRS